MRLEGQWAPFHWCPGTDCVWPRPSSQRAATSPAPSILAPGPLGNTTCSSRGGTPSRPRVAAAAACTSVDFVQAVFAARGDIARALDPGRAPLATRRSPPEEAPLKTTAGSRGLCLGRPPLCRPFGLAHGLDRARLRRLGRLALGLGPNHWGPSSARPRFWPPWRRDDLLPRSLLKTTDGGPLQRGPLRSVVFVRASWPCTWPRPCAAAVPQPPRRLGIVPQTAVVFQTRVRKNGVAGVERCPESLSSRQGPMSSSTPAIRARQTARSCPSHIVHISHSQPHSHPPRAPPTVTFVLPAASTPDRARCGTRAVPLAVQHASRGSAPGTRTASRASRVDVLRFAAAVYYYMYCIYSLIK